MFAVWLLSQVMGGLFTYIFDGIADKYKHELNLIAQQYPVEPLKYLRPTLRITFEEGIQMLNVSPSARVLCWGVSVRAVPLLGLL
jgi:aspartyl/asparaginyl-tRNA synthetase